MSKEYKKILLFFLILFSVYCALTIGLTWDEEYHLKQGKVIMDYLFSFGKVNKEYYYRENYSAIYWSLSYLISKQFPSQFQIEITHLINLIFSIATIFGIGKVGKELFNKKIGKIFFVLLFFYPVFFGHMAINCKDTILAFSHIWITYLLIKYLKNQDIRSKANKYIFSLGVLAAVSTGIQLVFLGSLIPIILLFLLDIFIVKKFSNINFNIKIFLYDFIKCFLIFYLLLILFWIDTHSNIIFLPINILFSTFSENYWTGWPFNLIAGDYYLSSEVPKNYLLVNFLFKSPEYILICYVFFTFLIFNKFFKEKIIFFYYKILFIISILLFPILILFFIPYPIYDGIRLFLWVLPYTIIIPGLVIYFLIENYKKKISKIMLISLLPFVVYFIFQFFSITPYQYTYLNSLNGKSENRYKKFENDYWGASIKELIGNIKFNKNKNLSISFCGVSPDIVEHYLINAGFYNYNFEPMDKAEYIILANRVVTKSDLNNKKLTNCFDKHPGENIFYVKRNNLILSTIRKNK